MDQPFFNRPFLDILKGIGGALLLAGLWFYPAAMTCVAVGAWNDVDPQCKGAIASQQMFDAIGLNHIEAINAYYNTVHDKRQALKAIKFIGVIKGLEQKNTDDPSSR